MAVDPIANNAEQFLRAYCKTKKYQIKKTIVNSEDFKFEISNNHERTIVMVFRTGKMLNQGTQNALRKEFEGIKPNFEQTPGDQAEDGKGKACTITYDILLNELRNNIRTMQISGTTSELVDKPTQAIEWRLKFIQNSKSVTLTQFDNGTLSIQGREDDLLDKICDMVEKIVNPSEKEIVARFISGSEEALKKCTPEIIQVAEKNIKVILGRAYDFLEPYDQKWLVAAECLCLAKVPLPEFSPVVMPASKAFEGFVKKILVSIGLCTPDHFSVPNPNFGVLSDETNPAYVAICARDRNMGTLLKKLAVCIKTNRHFSMHSDESKITKIERHEEACQKVRNILGEVKDFFDNFNKIFSLA